MRILFLVFAVILVAAVGCTMVEPVADSSAQGGAPSQSLVLPDSQDNDAPPSLPGESGDDVGVGVPQLPE